MPYPRNYPTPGRCTIKSKNAITNILILNDQYTITHINKLKEIGYYNIRQGSSLPSELSPFFNKPSEFSNIVRGKTVEALTDKFLHTLDEILMTIPEYAAKVSDDSSKAYWIEECEQLDSYLYQYNHAQYVHDSNAYQVNQSRAAYLGMVNHLVTHFKNEPAKFFEELYYTLKNKKFEIQTTGSESISTYTHISSWSFWAYGWVMINNEKFNFDKVSYRDSIHNRV